MPQQPSAFKRIKPVVILPDTSPLIHLAAANALHVLSDLGRVVIVDVVELEATYDQSKPFAAEIAAWIEEGRKPGSNHPVEIAVTELGPLYRLAIEQNVRPPRNAGEIGITEWLAEALRHLGGPALVVYETVKSQGCWRAKVLPKPLPLPPRVTCLKWYSRRALSEVPKSFGPLSQQHQPPTRPPSSRTSTRRGHDRTRPSRHSPILSRRDFRNEGRG